MRINAYTMTSWTNNQFWCVTLLVFKDLSNNDSIYQKLTVKCLINNLLILIIEFYDLDTYITLFLNTHMEYLLDDFV